MASRPELPAAKPKGVIPGRAAVIKLADPALIAQWRKPAPAGQVDVAAQQPFQGSQPAPPIAASKVASKGVQPSKPIVAKPVAVAKPAAVAKPMVEKTPDQQERSHPLDAATLELLPSELKAYQIDQNAIESTNPYSTDTMIYTPQSRKSFYRFVTDNYSDFRLAYAEKGKAVDELACEKLEEAKKQSTGKQMEAFSYQKFIREYVRNASPYRGLLVYHGLGSGKTCASIAAANALYGTSNKKIIVMTPFSLRGNFISELMFCGFRHFNVHNHWVKIPLTPVGSPVFTFAMSVLSMKQEYLTKRVLSRADPERHAIWVPDFNKPSNYNELSQENRNDIREQINHVIDSRIKFISYNGISAAELKRYACLPDPETGKRMFDDAVIVIDEVHNLTRLMQGQIMPYITEREGRKRKIEAEPIVPGRWEPKLCGKSENYKRAYLFYRLLTDARNSKIIGLSGTPIINFPEELGILANILAGYTECAEFSLLSTNKQVMEKVKELIEEEPRIDIVRFREGNQKMGVLISTFQEGYERVKDGDMTFIGVKYNEEAQEGIREIYPRIKAKLAAANIKIEEDGKKGPFVSYPRLPIDDETFKREFINPVNLKIINEVVLKKRLSGLISYYKTVEEYMPRVARDEIVRCEMSDYTLLEKYTPARNMEIQGEVGKKKEADDVFSAVEMFAKMKNPSSYRFRSRALCNFSFPKDIERPFPGTQEEEQEEENQIEVIAENAEVSEEVGDSEADREAAAMVAQEEQSADAALIAEGLVEQPVSSEAAATAAPQTGGSEEYDIEEYEEDEDEDENEDEDEDEDENEEEDEDEDEEEDEYSETIQLDEMEGGAGEEVVSIKKKGPRIAPKVINAVSAAPVSAASEVLEAPVSAASEAPVSAAPVSAAAGPEVSEVPVVKKRGPRVAPKPVPSAAAPVAAVAAPVAAVAAPVAAVAAPVSDIPRALSYKERIEKAMRTLNERRAEYLMLESEDPKGRLSTYSTKLAKMLENIEKSKGSNLVYSQFKTVEGLGVLGIALKANGYDEIKIVGSDQNPRFSDETLASFREGLGDVDRPKRKRFISFTGEGSKEQRTLVLNIFNGEFDKLPAEMRAVLEPFKEKKNTTGDICWVIGITGAGAEGISLKCCRSVHIMEPYWNNVRLDQVKGRAIRICSHTDLPFKEREVDLYTYYTVFSEEQKRGDKIDQTIRTTDNNETSDEKVFNVSVKKDKINQEILKIMQESAVDCELNAADNGGIQCFRVEGQPSQYLFDPNLDVDKIITSIEMKEVRGDLQSRVSRALDVGAPPAAPTVDRIKVIRIKGIEYLLKVKPDSSGTVFQLFGRTDTDFRKALGEVESDPLLGKYTRLHFYM